MTLVLSPSTMTTSILLRPPTLSSPRTSPSPSPSPISTPLPALQTDASSSSSSSYLDLHRASSARSTRRIHFAPLPEPNRDILPTLHNLPSPDPQSANESIPPVQPVPLSDDLPDGSAPLTPSDPTPSTIRSTPTLAKNTQKPGLRLLRPFSFLRRAERSPSSASPLFLSTSLPGSRSPSLSSLAPHSSSVPSSPLHSARLPRISEDFPSFRRMSLFRPRSGSSGSSTYPPRTPSPPPRRSDLSKSLQRSASTGSRPAIKQADGKRGWRHSFTSSHDTPATPASGSKSHRPFSSASSLGAGGGRHTAPTQKLFNTSTPRPSTAPGSLLAPPRKHVKMLNGRVYGAKRYAAQTLADPFANVRDEPEFVEWGYGGMGSVQASAGVGNEMWRGLQRSERGSALLTGSSSSSPSTQAGVGRSGTSPTSATARRKMSDNVPECGMGNVGVGGEYGEDDGSGMDWVKKRRAERESKARVEQEAKDLERKIQEKRKSGDSTMDASMYASTASTTTSLTACTSGVSTNPTTPLTSRSPSMIDLKSTPSPPESRDLQAALSSTQLTEPFSQSITSQSALPSKDEHEHHRCTAVRLSPNISNSSHKHEPERSSTSSSGDEDPQGSDEEDEHGDVDEEDDAQDVSRKTALGAGVEKISRHLDVEVR